MKFMRYQNSSIPIFNVKIKEKYWVLGFVSLFFLSAIILSFLVLFLYESMMIRSNRLPNVTEANKEFRLNIVEDFIDLSFNSIDKYIVVFGDSQFYGFGMAPVNTFPYILNKYSPDKKIINLSIVGGRSTDALIILKKLLDKKVKLEKIIYNINLKHYHNKIAEGFGRLPKDSSDENVLRHSFRVLKEYWEDWLIYEIAGWERSERPTVNTINKEGVKSFMPSKPRHNIKYLVELLELIKAHSEDHLIILAPFNEKALFLNEIERDSYLTEVLYLKGLAKKNNGKIKDLTFELNYENFLDSVHFSRKGHQRIADLLEQFITSPPLPSKRIIQLN
jgi:hypothetical protein